jgi:flavin reductase (DIM6/NTAB) family NADH-FMN oxidoreductase RutF
MRHDRRVVEGEELRRLMRRYPAGVSVVSVEAEGQAFATTMASLTPLSLEPPLVGISVGKQNALHELLREAGAFGVGLLSGEQEALASRFARGLPPIALWEGVAVREEAGPPLLAGALGWLRCSVAAECDAGDHTFFVGAVEWLEAGVDGAALVYVGSSYRSL